MCWLWYCVEKNDEARDEDEGTTQEKIAN